jgi:hypothetical protein
LIGEGGADAGGEGSEEGKEVGFHGLGGSLGGGGARGKETRGGAELGGGQGVMGGPLTLALSPYEGARESVFAEDRVPEGELLWFGGLWLRACSVVAVLIEGVGSIKKCL